MDSPTLRWLCEGVKREAREKKQEMTSKKNNTKNTIKKEKSNEMSVWGDEKRGEGEETRNDELKKKNGKNTIKKEKSNKNAWW